MKHSISKHKETVLNPVADSVSLDKPFAALRLRIQDLLLLVKFRLSATVVFSSVIAYLIAATGTISFTSLAILAAGGFLTTGAANTLNQVLEKDYDRLMKRTANRPLAAGRMKTSEAVLAVAPVLSEEKQAILDKIQFRIQSVLKGRESKYVLLNAPNENLEEIIKVLPGMKSPTVLPLAEKGWSSVHTVINKNQFWEIIDELKLKGAQGILVCPIEKMVI
jgi:ATP phosphoribosyltransferase-like protein